MEGTMIEKWFADTVKEVQDFYVDEVKRFIKAYNLGKSEILHNMENDYRSMLTILPEEKEGERRYLLEEEIHILGDIALALDPRHASEGGIRKFLDENYPKIEVKRGKVRYELKGHTFELYKNIGGYWLDIYKDGELLTSRMFQLAQDLEKLVNILKMISPFALDKDFKRIEKIIINLEKLIRKRSPDNIKKPAGIFRSVSNKMLRGIRTVQNIKEFYQLLDEAMGGFDLKKLENFDIVNYVDEIIKMRFGGGESKYEGRDPAQVFDEIIKPKIYASLEDKNLVQKELEEAKQKVEKAKEKIRAFAVVVADEVTTEQILHGVTNPFRAIEILEKMEKEKCEIIIKDIRYIIIKFSWL